VLTIRVKDEEARAVSQSASWTRSCGHSIQTCLANVRGFALAMVSTAYLAGAVPRLRCCDSSEVPSAGRARGGPNQAGSAIHLT
jgi:hypothetical protein